MDDLIEALGIFKKYIHDDFGKKYPTHCEHDVLLISVESDDISKEDLERLKELGFFYLREYDCMGSFRNNCF